MSHCKTVYRKKMCQQLIAGFVNVYKIIWNIFSLVNI